MKKTINVILMSLMLFIITACSNNKENPITEIVKETSLPKVISVIYEDGRTIKYTMSYNNTLQLKAINITRQYANEDDTQWIAEMDYDEKGEITVINLVNVDSDYDYTTTFNYHTNGAISDIEFVVDGILQATTFHHDPNNRIYGLDGELGNFPMGWRFDEDDSLTEMSVTSNYFQFTSSESEKGVFYHLDPQPALTIWYGLLFYLSHYELYYFNQKDLNSFQANDYSFNYKNKVRNQDGNLIAFKMVSDSPQASTISYTVSYENY